MAALLGIGLVLAPVVFQMFDRAPKGGDMIDGFEPYMTDAEIGEFEDHLAAIGAAHAELGGLWARLGPDATQRFPSLATFERAWPAIDDDMGSMLATMGDDIGRYRGVAALPPFPLFPWFFVLPGVLVAVIAGWALRHRGAGGHPPRWPRVALAVLGVGLLAAPAMFQMFTRAPGGAAMIDDFKPFMTTEKVTQIQGYFLTIGAGEGQLRTAVLPELRAAGTLTDAEIPAITSFNERWPYISGDMAPMIGAMADNVGNFDAVVALPPFWLFPWFFVVPGLALIALVLAQRAPRPTVLDEDGATAPRLLQGAPT
jgi:hypothetical protein